MYKRQYETNVNFKINEIESNCDSKISICQLSFANKMVEINENVDSKISETESSYKSEIQLLKGAVEMVNSASIQSERVTNNKFNLMEQKIINVKDDLNMVINKKLDSVNEQVVITRNVDSEIELELFTGDRRGVHPMQFLNLSLIHI